jgi:hypothetical protein
VTTMEPELQMAALIIMDLIFFHIIDINIFSTNLIKVYKV